VTGNDFVEDIVFGSEDFSPGWKPKIYDQATIALVRCFLFRESLLDKLDLWCCHGGVSTASSRHRFL
jgi:hypothetical protein